MAALIIDPEKNEVSARPMDVLMNNIRRGKANNISPEKVLSQIYGSDWEKILGQQPEMQKILRENKYLPVRFVKNLSSYGEYPTDSRREIRLGEKAYQDNVAINTFLHEFGHFIGEKSNDPQASLDYVDVPVKAEEAMSPVFDPKTEKLNEVKGKEFLVLGKKPRNGETVSISKFSITPNSSMWSTFDVIEQDSEGNPKVKNGKFVTKKKEMSIKAPIELKDLDWDSENFARYLTMQRMAALEGVKHPMLSESVDDVIEWAKQNRDKLEWHTQEMLKGLDKDDPRFNQALYDQVSGWSKRFSADMKNKDRNLT